MEAKAPPPTQMAIVFPSVSFLLLKSKAIQAVTPATAEKQITATRIAIN